jgi:hypothetical protein
MKSMQGHRKGHGPQVSKQLFSASKEKGEKQWQANS